MAIPFDAYRQHNDSNDEHPIVRISPFLHLRGRIHGPVIATPTTVAKKHDCNASDRDDGKPFCTTKATPYIPTPTANRLIAFAKKRKKPVSRLLWSVGPRVNDGGS